MERGRILAREVSPSRPPGSRPVNDRGSLSRSGTPATEPAQRQEYHGDFKRDHCGNSKGTSHFGKGAQYRAVRDVRIIEGVE
jgi:hypothetical protein